MLLKTGKGLVWTVLETAFLFHKADIAISTNGSQGPVDTGINIDGVDYFLFSVRACQAAGINLAAEKGATSGLFIILGVDGNNKYRIRLARLLFGIIFLLLLLELNFNITPLAQK